LFFRHLTRSRLAPEVRWEDPPLRACLLVDDPNLRSTRYGHIDYQVLARQAREWRFHVAMATIPLDQWSVSPRARQLFATHREHLSLVIHGHTHARAELARCATPEACRQLVAGAIRRILAAEQRFDLAIDRVMVPPHGEVNEAMLAALARGEVEAVATNRWSLWRHIAPAALGPAAEWAPAIWRGGLPIVHRYRFASPIAKQEALFAALTGRPILPYGHHQDFRDAAVVRRAVAEVNALGAVDWGPMRAVLERNYRHRNSGGRLVVRPYSRRVVVALPPDVDELQVDGPGGRVAIRWVGGETAARPLGPGAWLRPAGAREVEIRCGGAPAMATADEAAERIPVALRLRRLAAELRDRCLLGGAALGPAAEDFGQAVRLALAFS
jgi:hypothetical protein